MKPRLATPWTATATKRKISLCVLALLCAWPLVHYALSRSCHIDHWRFSGFAMYTRPTDRPVLEVVGEVNGQPLSQPALAAALGKDASRIDEYLDHRRLWGELAPPDGLARLILARIPQLAEVTLYIDTITLRPGDDSLSTFTDRYLCARPRSPDQAVCAREE